MITHSIEIARSPQEVFDYLDQLERHGEWQSSILEIRVDTDGPTRVGSRATERRKVPGGAREFTYEITVHEPPHRVSFHGLNGPVRPAGTVVLEPLDGGARSRLTLDFDMVGRGIGKLIAPLARREARRTIPEDHQQLKERLEAGA